MTVSDIANGTDFVGSKSALVNALVTAVTFSKGNAWVKAKKGDQGYNGSAYSGLELDRSGLTPTAKAEVGEGNRISFEGTVVNGSQAGPLNGVIVSISDQALSTNSGSSWAMSGGFAVADTIVGTLPSEPVTTHFSSITGIADTLGSGSTLLPRANTDFVH